MNSPKLRIFLTTSQISLVYATLFAKDTARENQQDILFIDANKRRPGMIELLRQTSEVYNWSLFHDFSIPSSETMDYSPSLRQSVMRRIKNKPLIKNIYGFFLDRHLAKADRKYRNELEKVLAPFLSEKKEIEFFLLTQTYLNRPLQQIFPDAQINYIEHGLPDYFNVLDPALPKGNLYCVFSDGYKRYLEKRGQTTAWVKQLPGLSGFPALAEQLIAKHAATLQLNKLPVPEQACVFIVLESVEMYDVKKSFHVDYLNRVFAQLENPPSFHYLLKPHPMQSQESISAAMNHFDSLGYKFTLLNQASISNASAELLFSIWKQNTKHVFCVFSAAGFYLSKLYGGEKITFWYSTEFMSNYLSNAPLQFREGFNKARPLIKEVFAEHCKAF